MTWADRPALPVVAHLVAVQPGGVFSRFVEFSRSPPARVHELADGSRLRPPVGVVTEQVNRCLGGWAPEARFGNCAVLVDVTETVAAPRPFPGLGGRGRMPAVNDIG